MKYDSNSTIQSIADVESFFHHLTHDLNVNFHPDNSFDQYINIKTKEPSFTADEVKLYDRLMVESFTVCEKEGRDIYEIGLNIMFPTMHTQDELIGKKVRIIEMKDEPRYEGREGIIEHFDSEGQMYGSWGGLAIQPERDKFEII